MTTTRLSLAALGCALAIGGCGDEPADAFDGTTDVGVSDTGANDDAAGDAGSGDTGASDATDPDVAIDSDTDEGGLPAPPDAGWFEGERYIEPNTHANVIRRMLFYGEEGGVADGFDLDERTSEIGDPQSCGHPDLVDSTGEEGIDNQLAVLWNAIVLIVGEQTEELLQGAINEGRVLIMIELADLDDLQNDDDVTVRIYRGLLDPELGTTGLISPDQTFAFDTEGPVSEVSGVALVDGALEAGPLEILIPLDILDLKIVLPLEVARVRLEIDDDGTFHGMIGGAINVPLMLEALLDTNAAAETRTVQPFFEANTDMFAGDDGCTHLSAALRFEGTTAFVTRPVGNDG